MRRVPVRLGVFALILAVVFIAAYALGGLWSEDHATAKGNIPVLATRTASGYTLVLDERGKGVDGPFYRFHLTHHDGMAVTDYATVKGAKVHAFVSRPDLSSFQHQTPKVESGGIITVPVPATGPWHFAFEFQPTGADPLVLAYDVTDSAPFTATALPDSVDVASVEGLEVLRNGWGFTVTVAGGGKPDGLEGYLGHAGHLLVLRQSDLAISYLWSTDNLTGSYSFGKGVTVPGTYRVFLQFGYRGKVLTVPFTVVVT